MLAQIKLLDWQPIATAPKDGTAVLGYFPGRRGYVARQDVVPIHWSGWGGGVWEDVNGGKPSAEPTHWMPLPDPPPPLVWNPDPMTGHVRPE